MRHQGKTPDPRPQAAAVPAEAEAGSRRLVDRLDQATPPGPRRRSAAANVELRVGILLWPGFPLLSLAGLCDGLRHAADLGDQSQQRRCSWAIIGRPGEAIAASCGVKVPVDRALTADVDYHYVAVIGGLLPQIGKADPSYGRFLKSVAAMDVPLIGICTGSFVLAGLGLLDGHAPCIHPFHVDDWQALHPGAPFETRSHFASSAGRMTCAGGVSIIELATELVRLHCGPDRAAKVVHQMTVNAERTSSHVSRRHALGYESSDREKLRQAIVLMEKNIGTPLEIAVIARLLKLSSRQLERIFLADTGVTPSQHYRATRLKYARYLLTTTDLSIATIAYEGGFSDASHFIRQFQQLYGSSPGRLRAALGSAGAA